MDVLQELDVGIAILQLSLNKEFRCNRGEAFFWPLFKPIYCGAINQAWEHSKPNSKRLSNGTEAND